VWAKLIIAKMIVSNLLKAKRNALTKQFLTSSLKKTAICPLPMAASMTTPFLQTPLFGATMRCNFSTKLSADDTMENIDDIFKQMNQVNLAKEIAEKEDILEPRVVS